MEELKFDLGQIGSRHLARFSSKSYAIKKLIADEKLAEDVRLHWLNICANEDNDQGARSLLAGFLEENKIKLEGSYQTIKQLLSL